MVFNSIKEKIIFYNVPVVLFSLLPFLLITGPFLSDLSISIITIIFLIYCLKRKNFSFFKNKYFYFFLIFWLYLIINSLFNNFNIDSLKISFFYFRYGVFVIAMYNLLEHKDNFLIYFFYCIVFCFFILIIDGFYQYFFEKNILGWELIEKARVTSFFGDEKILGSYLSRLWPLFFGLSIIFFERKKLFFLVLIFLFVFSEALIFLSGERVSFFFINLSALFVMFFSSKLLKTRLTILVLSLLLIFVVNYFNPSAKERIIDKTLDQMNITNVLEKNNENEKSKKIYIFSREHTDHYISAYKMFLDNVFFGVGVKNFRYVCSDARYYETKDSCSTHPHNTYIQILAELGLVGFTFISIVIFNICLIFTKHLRKKFKKKIFLNDFQICLFSGILIFVWPFVPTGNFFNNWLTIILIIYLPLIIWSKKHVKTS